MKFCPKCSLKIKGNLTQCPICKVELLSFAEDEEMPSKVTDEEYQKQVGAEVDSIFSTEGDTQDGKPSIDLKEPAQQKETGNSDRRGDYADLENRMSKLENDLKYIENKLNITLSQADIFKGTVLDLESKITKVDHSLTEIKNDQGTTFIHTQNIEEEISRLEVQLDHLSEDLESVKNNLKDQQDKIYKLSEECSISMRASEENRDKIKNLALDREMPSSSFEERQAQGDGLPSEKIEISDKGIGFPESEEKDFETEYEPFISPQSEDDFSQPERTKKRNFPLIIVLTLATLILFSWLGLHYFKSLKQGAQKEITAQKSTIAPPLNRNTLNVIPKSYKTKPTQKARIKEKALKPSELSKKPSQGKKVVPDSKGTTKKQSSASKKSKTRQVALSKTSGYTINISSFRDKKRAHALTKKLLDKGYPVLMSSSKKNNWYRVRIGAFSTVKEARSYATTFEKKEKLPTFITKIK